MTDKKQLWQEIQAKAPHLAELLKAINACGLGKSTIKGVKFNEEYKGKR